MRKILIIAICLACMALVACGQKTEPKNDNAAAAQTIPPDPAIDPKALLGTWTQTVDDDPSIYTFMENGKCTEKELIDTAPRDCTYELQSPDKAGGRFNMIIINHPAAGDNEEYFTKERIRVSGDKLEFPDIEGNVSMYNKYKKTAP